MKPFPFEDDFVVSLVDVAVRLGDRRLFEGTSWQIRRGEQWAVMGPNGAGKSTLALALAGELPIVRGRVIRGRGCTADNVGYVSFELHRRLIAREEGRDHARYFSGDWGDQATVRQLFDRDPAVSALCRRAAQHLAVTPLLGRAVRTLSTGEMRKVLIARALSAAPGLLILDEPFDGLDAPSRNHLMGLIGRLMAGGTPVVLITHRRAEIPREVTHFLRVEAGKVVRQGPRECFFREEREKVGRAGAVPPVTVPSPFREVRSGGAEAEVPEVLIEMKGVRVRCGSTVILQDLDWTVRRGENWTILGPNGTGKTTLLGMISGDHPQAYANEITLFGRRRGSGESIWEIKAPIGMISSELHIRYRKPVTALEAVLSGFHDSVGLFRRCTPAQRESARDWLRHLGMADKEDRRFPHLSHGEQRMVLLARAMVKAPSLLILDEPCQGLDAENRRRILSIIDAVGRHTPTHILYVTHHPEEIPACTTHMLRFVRGSNGRCRAEMESGPLVHG